ncbi:MAG: EamA family transporter [Actinobacteria bacterium]|uniref:Unannotated protein n=1 Tax=freshwater metagenome TaxID=449393 RepID=A0A6J7KQH9_9ZZZZ|nr:EamA family transporter [Actinomycetota bacterium]
MYLLLALSSGLLWGVQDFGYARYGRLMSSYSVLLLGASGAALTFLIAGLVHHDTGMDTIDVGNGLMGGFLELLSAVLLMKAYTMGKCGVATGVNASYVLTPLCFSLIIGEAISSADIAGSLIIVTGLVLFFLVKPSASEPSSRPFLSAVFAFASAVFFGAALVALDIGSRDNLYATLFVGQLPIIAVTLFMVAKAKSFGGLRTRDIGPLLGAGFALALAGIAFYTAADNGDLGIVSVLSSISPIATGVLAFLILKERMIRSEILALVIVLSGVALVVV